MPDAPAHLDKVCSNLEFLVDVCAFGARRKHDWEITVVFYAAVHIIEAKLAELGVGFHSGDHRERNDHLKKRLRNRELYDAYSALKSKSRDARYAPTELPAAQFSPEEVRESYSILEDTRRLCALAADSQLDSAFKKASTCTALR